MTKMYYNSSGEKTFPISGTVSNRYLYPLKDRAPDIKGKIIHASVHTP
jgi:hypothetical protein